MYQGIFGMVTTNKEPGDPSVSLLLTSEKAVFCNTIFIPGTFAVLCTSVSPHCPVLFHSKIKNLNKIMVVRWLVWSLQNARDGYCFGSSCDVGRKWRGKSHEFKQLNLLLLVFVCESKFRICIQDVRCRCTFKHLVRVNIQRKQCLNFRKLCSNIYSVAFLISSLFDKEILKKPK